MAEDENPKRKKLSLHGNKKLSLGTPPRKRFFLSTRGVSFSGPPSEIRPQSIVSVGKSGDLVNERTFLKSGLFSKE